MAEIEHMYMTVSVDVMPQGLNLSCWMSTVDFWMSEKAQFPHQYTHMGDRCTWIIHANEELTIKACAVVTEYADRICIEQTRKNDKRKIANRS